ncbi:hypothetical protein LIER_15202 [Lithospermum erythrorhizon]|uniref:SnoaL-like domain-containing protein n=1 Tax=Lithospermum erythrorhizon TaxID=34254 RepID=A0AAV3Q3J7_LITER
MRIMSSNVAGAGQIMLLSNAKSRQPIKSLCSSTSLFQFKHAKIKKQLHFRVMEQRIKPLKLVALSRKDDHEDINISLPLSPSDTIKQFYAAINEKNLEEIKGLLSDDCIFDDFSFPIAFQGKKETVHFLEYLITTMGENIEFNVERILEGEGHAAAVNWHLEWKKRHVPLTRGSSYFEFSRIEDKFLIKKARVIVEPPIKPGGFGLAHFSIVTSLFDAFPEATEAFLKKPHFIYQILLKAYVMGCKRIVDPLLACYIKFLNFTARFLRFLFKTLHYIVQLILARKRSDDK